MFHVIPWKRRNRNEPIAVLRAEPTRQDLADDPRNRLREELESLLHSFFDESWFVDRERNLPSLWDAPRFDWDFAFGWEDEEKQYVFQAELPGFEPEEIDVQVRGNRLTIRAEHRGEVEQTEGGAGYRYGSFFRSFTLPSGVDEAAIDASYHSGVLEVHLPKTKQAQGKRISVMSD